MDVCLTGINHRTAPVAVREKAAIRFRELGEAFHVLRTYISHGVILSTCNRTEVYTVSTSDNDARSASLRFLQTHLDMKDAELQKHTYVMEGAAVVEHLFHTAAGLDSMIIGEYEILGQVRQALEGAEKAGMVNLPLRRLFQDAVRTGRRVREETGISKNALSVSSVAVDMATRVVGELKNSRMLVIGAGEAGRLVAKAARDRGASRIVIASRTQKRASVLTEMLGGVAISMDALEEELPSCNIVITCADAPHCLLDVPQIESVMQKRPELPMVIIDIAVPRNVEMSVSQIENVHLYNIDDLSHISEQNRQQREAEIKRAEDIIISELSQFSAWWRGYKVRPIVTAMMNKAEAIRRTHLERTMKKLPSLTEEEQYNLEMMTRAIVQKILKEPIHNLKANGHDSPDYADMVRKLFHLDVEA